MTRCERDGLTLIEVLAAVALLGSVLLGAAGWIRASAEVGLRFDREVTSARTVAACFAAIAADLELGDEEIRAGAGTPVPPPKVTVHDGVLSIRTRTPGSGATLHRYALRASDHVLLREERSGAGLAGAAEPRGDARVLLGEVTAFEATMQEKPRRLHVTLAVGAGPRVERHWSLP